MNPIHQSLSSLLSNPALQPGSTSARSGGSRTTERSRPAENGSTDSLATSARQALASQNDAARVKVVGDLGEAKELTRLVQSALRGGLGELAAAHRNLDSRNVASLLR